MSNREHRSFNNDIKLETYIKDYPQYVADYYYSLHLEQRSKNTYVKTVCSALEYMKNQGEDINTFHWVTVTNVNRYLHTIEKTKRFGEEKRTSFSYQKLVWSCLNSFFKFLLSINSIKENPMDKIQRAKGKDNVKRVYMSRDDIHNVINSIIQSDSAWKFRDIVIVKIMLQTGIRSTALLDIDVDDITFNLYNKYMPITHDNIASMQIKVIDKNNQYFEYYLTRDTALDVYSWLLDRELKLDGNNIDALFISNKFTRLTLHGLEKVIEKLSPVIGGKQITPHKYRATFGTLLYQNTKDIHYVQRQMHHSSPDTTQIYIVNDNGDSVRAAELMGDIIGKAI